MISKILINWYTTAHRELPWRNTKDPYKVWVSEIILQQTQVVQGLPYYNRFIEKFPTAAHLAKAKEDEVLKLWQGLGYYSRARNLHFSAKYITKELKGQFPKNFQDIKQLKGVGDYTAAAIASFCYKEFVPVVDGNVMRFISRYFGIEEPIDSGKTVTQIREICQELIPKNQPDVFNQAIMEFGALMCKPNQPNCAKCPLNKSCWALANNKVNELPFKAKKIKKRNRYFYYLFIKNGATVVIEKRKNNDIWKGLYQFPILEEESKLDDKLLHKKLNALDLKFHAKSNYKKHLLSHQTIYAALVQCSVKKTLAKEFSKMKKIKFQELEKYALPKLIDRLLNENKLKK
ncbi:MAG: A/G-specific adenine glycosylase [Bacteroidia bacterium]